MKSSQTRVGTPLCLSLFLFSNSVNGVEYTFGYHDCPTSGVYDVETRQCPGFELRKSIFMGKTCLDPVQVSEIIEYHSGIYNGDTYHFIVKICNHSCDDICYKLVGKRIPKWVNRLAKIVSLCKCILPKAPKVISHNLDFRGYERKKKRVWRKLSLFSVPDKKLSMSSLFLQSHYKVCLPPWELKNGIL